MRWWLDVMVDSLQKKSCVSLHEDLFQIPMGYLQMKTFNTQINPFSPVDLFPQPLQLCPRPRPIVLKSNHLLQDFHGGPVVTNLPAKTGDMGSSLAWGDHMWWGNQICAL